MKKLITRLTVTLASAVLPTAAFAGEFSAADLVQATQVALKIFSDASPGHVGHITGFKTWKSGADAKVKVYMTHDGMAMEMNYQCTGAGGQIRCTAI